MQQVKSFTFFGFQIFNVIELLSLSQQRIMKTWLAEMVDMDWIVQKGMKWTWKKKEKKNMKILSISTIFGFGPLSNLFFVFVFGAFHLLTHHFLCQLYFICRVTWNHVNLCLTHIRFFNRLWCHGAKPKTFSGMFSNKKDTGTKTKTC